MGLEFVRPVKFFGASYVCPDGKNTKATLKMTWQASGDNLNHRMQKGTTEQNMMDL